MSTVTLLRSKKPAWFNRTQSGLGIDLGSLQTKVLWYKRGDDGSVATAKIHTLPLSEEPPVLPASIADRRTNTNSRRKAAPVHWTTQHLTQVLSRIPAIVTNHSTLQNVNINVALSMSACDFRTIYLPRDTPMTQTSVQHALAESIGDSRKRSIVILPNREASPKIRLLSIPEEFTWKVGDILDHYRLTPKTIDGLPWCMARAVQHVDPSEGEEIRIALDWSFSQPTLIATVGGKVDYVRQMSVGGMLQLGSRTRSELRHHEVGPWIQFCLDPNNLHQPSLVDHQQSIYEQCRELAQEVTTAVEYIRWRNRGVKIENIWLIGGGACCPQLVRTLQQEMKVNLRVWQADLDGQTITADFAVASSLARLGMNANE